MIRELFLAAALATAVAGCTTAGEPTPAPSASSGIALSEASRIVPLAPARLTAAATAHGVRLAWPDTGEDVSYYQLLRRAATASQWQSIGRSAPGQLSFLDPDPPAGTYVYGVQAVSPFGVASTITESRPVTAG